MGRVWQAGGGCSGGEHGRKVAQSCGDGNGCSIQCCMASIHRQIYAAPLRSVKGGRATKKASGRSAEIPQVE